MLPLEPSLARYIHRNSRDTSELIDIRQEVYERALSGAANGIPQNTKAYVFTIARNLLISRAKRARIVSFELAADIDEVQLDAAVFDAERHLSARDELRRTMEGLELLPPRCREVVRLRKVEGLSTREVAERMGTGRDAVEKQLTIGMRALIDFMLGGSGKIRRSERGPNDTLKRGAQ
ncbi:RNA polymerase sigma factor [Sphingomonas sp. HITSZ_GF]|uniref:RNA polymerase sigma factor n=1 Tax=Sphingomonas sp. HITSZ_GF TaxID=3037247 RepID=UPI00240E0A37|nr:RNA polymerase sigma factor [Sphingomonas sp. HITSZ_GF]MDG2533030.1 RNA polymerase sigma factor [Sphingomonas sp. HITSZ_GF]